MNTNYFQAGIDYFNQQEFYLAHEEIEQIWLKDRSEARLFYQGLIITAGGFCHFQKQKIQPSLKALKKALIKFENYPDQYLSINLKQLRSEMKDWIYYLESLVNHQVSIQPKFPII